MNTIRLRPNCIDETQRHEWLDSLSADERLVLYMPVGYRAQFLVVSLIKRSLMVDQMSVGERLQFLEGIAGFVDDRYMTAEVIATIAPMGEVAANMISEAMALRENERWDLLSSWDVFGKFLSLEPSFSEAIRLIARSREQSASDRSQIQ